MPTDPSLAGLDEIAALQEDTPETPEVETQAPVEDTPAAPEVPTVDFEKRYNDLRSEFDRRAQREAEREERLRQYEEQLSALQAQPHTPAPYDGDEEDYIDDPLQDPRVQAYLQKVDRLEAQLAEKAQQETLEQERAREHAFIDAELDRFEKATQSTLSDRMATWIGREALANRDPITGQPDVEGALAAYRQEMEAQKAQWVDTKRGAPAPVSGPGAVEVPDLDDPDAREDYLQRAFEGGLG